MPIQFDNKISFGHVASVVSMVVLGSIAYGTIAERQAKVSNDIAGIVRLAEARESRIRAVEIALAGTSSDLRSIQVGISRIEAQLEKLQNKP